MKFTLYFQFGNQHRETSIDDSYLRKDNMQEYFDKFLNRLFLEVHVQQTDEIYIVPIQYITGIRIEKE